AHNVSQNVLDPSCGVAVMNPVSKFLAAGLFGSFLALVAAADDQPKKGKARPEAAAARAAAQEALAELNPLIGGWRGVGLPIRNSNKGSWSETAEWIWEIKKDRVGVRYNVKEGKHLATALVTWDPENEDFVLEATLPDKSERTYTGKSSGNK